MQNRQLGPLTTNTERMSDSDKEQSFVKHNTQDKLQIRHNGKVTSNTIEREQENKLDLSDLVIASAFSSSAEMKKKKK